MAKPSWLTVSPMSGSGNGVLQNTGSVHTGRNVRTGTVTVTATGVACKACPVPECAHGIPEHLVRA